MVGHKDTRIRQIRFNASISVRSNREQRESNSACNQSLFDMSVQLAKQQGKKHSKTETLNSTTPITGATPLLSSSSRNPINVHK